MIHAKTSTLKYYYTINLHTVQSDHTLERNIFDKSYAEKPLFFHTVQRVEHPLVPVDVKERFPRAEPVHNGRLLGRPFLGEPQDVRRLLQRGPPRRRPASPTMRSPGRTISPPMQMGWLIVPSVALAVPRTQSPAEKTGKPIRMISRLSRTVQDTTRPAAPRAMHSTASTSPNGPEATAEPMSATMTSPGASHADCLDKHQVVARVATHGERAAADGHICRERFDRGIERAPAAHRLMDGRGRLSLVCAQQRGIAARDVPSDVRQLIPHPSRYSLRRHNV